MLFFSLFFLGCEATNIIESVNFLKTLELQWWVSSNPKHFGCVNLGINLNHFSQILRVYWVFVWLIPYTTSIKETFVAIGIFVLSHF
jgi:hypothetical protein